MEINNLDELFESVYREAVPAGFAVLVDGKVWDNALTEDRAKKVVDWLKGKGKFKDVRVLTPKDQDRRGANLKDWSFDEKKAIGF